MDGEEIDDKFNFHKSSYITVGSIKRNCIKLMQPEKPDCPQAIAIADARGVLYISDHLQNEPVIKCKTNPLSREITAIDTDIDINKERIFFSSSNTTYMTNSMCKVSLIFLFIGL